MKPSLSGRNKFILLVSVILGLFIIMIFAHSINKPLNWDETDFANAARSILNDPKAFSKNPELGLWHPPVYIYMLAAVFNIFGMTTMTARGLGFWFYIINFILLLLICRELFEAKESRVISFIAGCLYLVSPFLIQYSLLVDIDGGLLPLGVLVFCYFFIRFNKRGMNIRNIFALGFIFALNLLIKFTTPPLIIPAIFLFYLLKRDYKKAFLCSLSILAIGVSLAWGAWYLYCRIFNIQLFYPIIYTFSTKWSFGGLGVTPDKIYQIVRSVIWFLYWVSPGLTVLMVISICKRLSVYFQHKVLDNLDFLVILGAMVWFMYNIYFSKGGLMKYHVIYCLLFIIVVSRFIYEVLTKDGNLKIREIVLSSCLGVAVCIYYSAGFPDMLLNVRFGKLIVSDFFLRNYSLLKVLYFAPFLAVPAILYVQSRRFYYSLILGFSLLALASNVSEDIKQTAGYTTSCSWRNYGEDGLRETIFYLNKKLSAGGAFCARKDVGYAVRFDPAGSAGKIWLGDIFPVGKPPIEAKATIKKLVQEHDIAYIVCHIYDDPELVDEVVSPYFTREINFANFLIYKKS